MASWWEDWWGSVESGFKSGFKEGEKTGDKANKALGTPDLGGAISQINDTVNLTKAIWLNLSDYRMWRSVGWIALGILLMIVGFFVWNRKAIGSVAKMAI